LLASVHISKTAPNNQRQPNTNQHGLDAQRGARLAAARLLLCSLGQLPLWFYIYWEFHPHPLYHSRLPSKHFVILSQAGYRINRSFLSTIFLPGSTFAPDSLISLRYYRCARAVLRRHFIFFDQRRWYGRRAQRPVQRTLCRHTTSRVKARRLRKRAAPSAHGQLLQPMYRLARSASTR
jgi:hypothetical protein